MSRWKPLFGAIAAACVALVAFDAFASTMNYPLFRALFGEHWRAAVSATYALGAIGAAFFGYLAGHITGRERGPYNDK
jgi:hypothetical protein